MRRVPARHPAGNRPRPHVKRPVRSGAAGQAVTDRIAREDVDGLPMPRRMLAIGAASFGNALVILDGAIANVALPTIARALDVSGSEAVLIVTVYQLVLVMTLLPFAALGDRIGHRTLYQYGQLVFTAATLLCFFARSLPFLLVVRAAQALGAAAALAVSSALIRAIYPKRQLGRGLGLNSVIVTSSAALAPTLGGLILGIAPWPWLFASAVPLAILSLILGRYLPDPRPRDEPFDVQAAALSAATFGLVIAGLEGAVHGSSPVVAAAVAATGAVIGFIFVRHELRSTRPILPIDLLAKPVFALSNLGALCAFVASMNLILSMPFRLQQEFGFSAAETGAVLAAWPLVMIVVAPSAGALSDRFPAGILGGIGMAIACVGILLVATMPHDVGHYGIAARMALTGAGFGLFLSPNARLQIGSAPPDRAASAGGLISTTRLLGQTLGATLAAAMLAYKLGGAIPPFVSAGLALIAGLCSLARMRPTLRKPQPHEVPDI